MEGQKGGSHLVSHDIEDVWLGHGDGGGGVLETPEKTGSASQRESVNQGGGEGTKAGERERRAAGGGDEEEDILLGGVKKKLTKAAEWSHFRGRWCD